MQLINPLTPFFCVLGGMLILGQQEKKNTSCDSPGPVFASYPVQQWAGRTLSLSGFSCQLFTLHYQANHMQSHILTLWTVVVLEFFVNGPHLYSAFIQSAVQCIPLIHPFTHTFTHQRRLAAVQDTDQLVRSSWGLGVFLRDTSTRPGWDRTGNPPTARRQLWAILHM